MCGKLCKKAQPTNSVGFAASLSKTETDFISYVTHVDNERSILVPDKGLYHKGYMGCVLRGW